MIALIRPAATSTLSNIPQSHFCFVIEPLFNVIQRRFRSTNEKFQIGLGGD